MTAPSHESPIESLLVHRECVRTVARRLAANAFDADDLEQEAWLAAMHSPPRPGEGLRAWFGKVVLNRFRKTHRGESRRGLRERAAARPESVAGGAALVAEAEANARLGQAVVALAEPYRETVLLRYFEALPPREVAARMSVPVETVRTRLRRASELLREALGARDGDDAAWLGAIAPLVAMRGAPPVGGPPLAPPSPIPSPVAVTGWFASSAAWKVGGAATAAVAFAVAFVFLRPGDVVPPDTGSAGEHNAGIDAAQAKPRRGAPRAPVAAAPADAGAPEEPAVGGAAGKGPPQNGARAADPVGHVSGRVVFADGKPAAGAAVRTETHGRWAETDADGAFEAESWVRKWPQRVWAVLPGFRMRNVAPVAIDTERPVAVGDIVLDPDPFVTVRGRVVVGPSGSPASGGEVRLHAARSGVVNLPGGTVTNPSCREMFPDESYIPASRRPTLPDAAQRIWNLAAPVGDDGSFAIGLPLSYGVVRLDASVPGCLLTTSAAVDLESGTANGVLIEAIPLPRVAGVVVDAADGSPVAGAKVSFQGRSGAAGVTDTGGRFDLAAGDGDTTMVSVQAEGFLRFHLDARTAAAAGAVRIALRRPCSIAGRVVAGDGRPIGRAFVSVCSRSAVDDGTESVGSGQAVTDADGRFVVGYIRDETYDVTVLTERSAEPAFARRTVPGVPAGTTDLVVVVDEAPGTIEGCVVDDRGEGVREGVHVTASADGVTVATSLTGRDGRFVLRGLRPGMHRLQVTGSMFMPQPWQMSAPLDVVTGANDVRLVSRRTLQISGVVVDRAGRRVPGAVVATVRGGRSAFGNHPQTWPCPADALGEFQARGLYDGEVVWLVASSGETNGSPDVWYLGGERVTAGATGIVLTQVLCGTIEGTVEDASGAPLPGVAVAALWDPSDRVADGRRATTDARGRFVLAGLPSGRAFTVVAEGAESAQVANRARLTDIAVGARNVRVVVPR